MLSDDRDALRWCDVIARLPVVFAGGVEVVSDELLTTRKTVTAAHGRIMARCSGAGKTAVAKLKRNRLCPNLVPTCDSHEVIWLAIGLTTSGYVSAPYGAS